MIRSNDMTVTETAMKRLERKMTNSRTRLRNLKKDLKEKKSKLQQINQLILFAHACYSLTK